MEQYISKDALVREIEERIKKYATINVGNSSELDALYGAKCHALKSVLSFLDTLEVKEVEEEPVSNDLEEAVNAYIGFAPEVDECSSVYGKRKAFKAGAQWQKEQMLKEDKS